jgi:hypothetical protein
MHILKIHFDKREIVIDNTKLDTFTYLEWRISYEVEKNNISKTGFLKILGILGSGINPNLVQRRFRLKVLQPTNDFYMAVKSGH